MLKERWQGLWSEEEGIANVAAITDTLEEWGPPRAAGLGDLIMLVLGEEIQSVLAATKLGTAPGEDGLPWDFWKKMVHIPGMVGEMAALCGHVLQGGEWVGEQDLGLVALLYKDKGR